MSTRYGIFFAIMLLNFQVGANADENMNWLLRGDYRISANSFCVQTSEFGDPPTYALLGYGISVDDHGSGVITFDGAGSATEISNGFYKVEGFPDAFSPGRSPAGTYENVCTYTYVVEKDRSVTMNGSCDSLVTSGGPTPYTVHVSGIRSSGQIDRQRDVLIGTSADNHIITLEDSFGGVYQRRCGATSTAIRIRSD